jgi:hypothetical protein
MADETFNPKEKLKTCNENTGPFAVLRNVSPTQHCAGKAILTLLYISRLLMLTLKNSHCCGSRRDLRIVITRKCPGIFTRDNVVHDNARSHVATTTIQDTMCSVFLEGVGPFAIPPTRAA